MLVSTAYYVDADYSRSVLVLKGLTKPNLKLTLQQIFPLILSYYSNLFYFILKFSDWQNILHNLTAGNFRFLKSSSSFFPYLSFLPSSPPSLLLFYSFSCFYLSLLLSFFFPSFHPFLKYFLSFILSRNTIIKDWTQVPISAIFYWNPMREKAIYTIHFIVFISL